MQVSFAVRAYVSSNSFYNGHNLAQFMIFFMIALWTCLNAGVRSFPQGFDVLFCKRSPACSVVHDCSAMNKLFIYTYFAMLKVDKQGNNRYWIIIELYSIVN